MLAPSLLSADLSDLKGAVRTVEAKGGSVVHIDVMDGRFVPQITYGQPVVKSLRPLTKLPFDVHLMVERPEDQIESFAAAGADWITFHAEAAVHAHRLVRRIQELGLKAGVAIVPSTPVSQLSEILEFADIVLVMTVDPGFGGQQLISSCVNKIRELAELRGRAGFGYRISVDGGVNQNTIAAVAEAGADILVSGSAFFDGDLKWEAGK